MRVLVKVKVIGLLVAAAVCLVQIPAWAAAYKVYSLPPLKGNNYTSAHTKQTDAKSIENRVTSMDKTSTVTFWACDVTKSQISKDYDQKVGSKEDIEFLENKKLRKGQQVIMGMQNGEWSWDYAFVSGEVDFR
jgi:hypothetical protein